MQPEAIFDAYCSVCSSDDRENVSVDVRGSDNSLANTIFMTNIFQLVPFYIIGHAHQPFLCQGKHTRRLIANGEVKINIKSALKSSAILRSPQFTPFLQIDASRKQRHESSRVVIISFLFEFYSVAAF